MARRDQNMGTRSAKSHFKDGKRPFKVHKKRKNESSTGRSASALKRRLRDLGRLLQNSTALPADIRIGHEREVQSLQNDLVNARLEKERHEMIGRYHMVRFFERQKATRNLKKAKRALDQCQHAKQKCDLERAVHIAEVDLNYTMHYPHRTAYHSLWTKTQDKDGKEHYDENGVEKDGAKGNVEIWREVEAASREGMLDKLRERIDEDRIQKVRESVSKFGLAPKDADKKSAVVKTASEEEEAEEEEEDETGAGFFE